MGWFLSFKEQYEDWKRFLEYHPDIDVEDVDDIQPSREEVLRGEVKSPSALEGGGFRFGIYELVGHGNQTNGRCGTFHRILACSRVELHNKMIFDVKTGSLIDFSGKADVHPTFYSCDKPSCPICYERGWGVREADNVNFHFEESVKRLDRVVFGDVEHIIVALDSKYWYFDEKTIRKLVLKGLKNRGVVGGCLIPHWARFDHDKWRWKLGVHYHVLGYIRGGFRKCRGCPYVNDKGSRFFCKDCEGFYGVSKKFWKSDGLIVEVKDKRKSIFGTAWYQLHHATIRTDKKRSHVVTWFGVCSSRHLKISKEARREYKEKRRAKCRICGSPLVRHEYCGRDLNVLAWFKKRRGAREKVEPVFLPACDLVERPEKWGSGSYGEG
jgi:hypothetical protein